MVSVKKHVSLDETREPSPPPPPPAITVVDLSNYPKCVSADATFKECRSFILNHAGETMCLSVFKTTVGHKDFLGRVFTLFDDDCDQLLDQDILVTRVRSRLTGTRDTHLAEVIVTAIYAHAFDQLFNVDIFCRIFATKELLDKVFRVIDKDGDGSVTIREVMEFLANLTNAKPRDGLTTENVKYLEQLFREHTRGGDEIHVEDFRKIVKSKNSFFTERVFSVFDRDGSGAVSLQEFLDAISKFAGQSPDDKINFLFRIYDIDGDGFIQHNELRHVMKACMEENGMKFSEEQIEELTTALFEDADPSGTGAITFEALKAQLAKHEGLLENLSTSIERWLVPPKPERHTIKSRIKSLMPPWMSWRYYRNNRVFILFLFFFIGINIALFVSRAYEFRNSNGFVILARACGQCLNFTSMMLVVFMLRSSITWLRTHGFSSYLPLDDHIFFHKLTGIMVFVYSVVHTIMHLCNFNVLVEKSKSEQAEKSTTLLTTDRNATVSNSNFTVGGNDSVSASSDILTMVDCLFTTKVKLGLVPGWASITGDLLIVILIIMVLCSMRCVRKGGYFEVFYWTHQLYVAFWVLLILHGPRFWMWFVGPATIYILEKIIRQIRLSSGRGKTIITEGVLLPSKVTHLVVRRPPSFIYHPGDYIFIRIPAIARSEWHPFTLSSAPEQEDFIWLHIRAVGEWTKKLYDYVEKQRQRCKSGAAISISIDPGSPTKTNGISESIPLRKSVHINENMLNQVSFVNMGMTEDDVEDDIEETLTPAPPNPSPTSLAPPSPTGSATSDTKVVMLRPRMGHKALMSTRSMPDVDSRMKQREKKLRFRELPRSASAKSFDERILSKANKLATNGRRPTMAQSFKHLRHKPNVVQLSPIPDGDHISKDEPPSTGTPILRTVSVASTASRKQIDKLIFTEDEFSKPLEVYIDGPFGAPSSHIFRAQHAVLIATGIGVTPFASILQSIMRRYWKERHTCPRCSYEWTGEIPQSVMNLRKVDFFWINRDQRSFEWFVNLLSQLEIEQAELGGAMERFLDMHMYITSALQRADMKALGLQLALDLLHEKEKRDLITGLKTRTQSGRPNWNKVFKQISEQRKGKVTVFYCGPPELGRMLQVKCDEFGFTFRKEVF